MNLTNHLKAIGYDYLPLCHFDGVTDDSRIIQMRMHAGLDPFKTKIRNSGGLFYIGNGNHKYMLKNSIKVPSNFIIDGRKI
jgi:hypothetical protein